MHLDKRAEARTLIPERATRKAHEDSLYMRDIIVYNLPISNRKEKIEDDKISTATNFTGPRARYGHTESKGNKGTSTGEIRETSLTAPNFRKDISFFNAILVVTTSHKPIDKAIRMLQMIL